MQIIEIKQLFNGSHRNQNSTQSIIPDGWALIPDDLETSNFPFGDVEIKEINGVSTVIKWIPLNQPDKNFNTISSVKMREEIYNTKKSIEWEKSMITVTEASQKWLYYTAEGDNEKANELQKLIKKTKQEIREKYPN